MSILRRYKSDFNIYFVTNVTYYRRLILLKNGDLLMAAIESLKNKNNTLNPFDWEYSSIHGYFQDGYYSDDWGRQDIVFGGNFGE